MDLFISLYQDGVYRQRCGEHLAEAPARSLGVWKVVKGSSRVTCPVCWWRKRLKGGEGDVVVMEGDWEEGER